jgi:hypothetical protein
MKRPRAHWIALLFVAVLALLSVALVRPAAPYAGHVLYLRLSLVWPGRPALTWENQYWIDNARGRIVYAQGMSGQGSAPLLYDETPASSPTQPWYVIMLARQPDGRCAVVYTTLLDRSERDTPFVCADLLALKDVSTLKARMRALAKRYGLARYVNSATVRVPLPGGVDPIPLVMDRFDMRYGYERLQPGGLVLSARTGIPVSTDVYRREGKTLVEYVRRVDDAPPGTLPGDFFDAPRLSLPDRARALYRWLRQTLPWRP